MSSVIVKSITRNAHYRTSISARNHTIIADEPFEENGSDLGMMPTELLAGALASCTSITLRMYADRKEWDVESFEVEVELIRDTASGQTTFLRKVNLIGNLDETQRKRILSIANACPVHKILTGSIQVETILVD
ncbi:MAG: hypothetical protein RL264_803 [Bacteroidota bacterium]|jgi:putative redox protein